MGFIKSGVDDADVSVSWKTCVHSLNILRLILLDAALGPEADAYIPQAVMYAVRGFKSELWAVRNSCMMVFSAIVQRAVDNDKKECGGAKAATAIEFFQRYPSLFPFLLNELATILDFDVQTDADIWPKSVCPSGGAERSQENYTLPPTLFPILLLLSKLRCVIHFDMSSMYDAPQCCDRWNCADSGRSRQQRFEGRFWPRFYWENTSS